MSEPISSAEGRDSPSLKRYRVARWKDGRFWAVWRGDQLLCVTVYKRGAISVVEVLQSLDTVGATDGPRHAGH